MKRHPLPVPDRDSLPWWEALRRHQLFLQRCSDCTRYRWPPRAVCNDCGSLRWGWTPASGRGEIASWTVTHHTSAPDVNTPYVVVLVRLAEQDDIFIPGNYEPADGAGLAIDAEVAAEFEEIVGEDGTTATLLSWRLAG